MMGEPRLSAKPDAVRHGAFAPFASPVRADSSFSSPMISRRWCRAVSALPRRHRITNPARTRQAHLARSTSSARARLSCRPTCHASEPEPAPLPVTAASVFKRSRVERASRSRRVTISTSPLANWSSERRNRARLVRAAGLLAVDFGATFGAELLELSVERLPVGAGAGVSEVAILRASCDHIFCKPYWVKTDS